MFAGFASTTPTDTHSVYRTYHFVIGVEHILSDSAPGHSTNRLLSFTSLRDCPCASCLRQPPPLPPVPRLSATHCPAGGFLTYNDFLYRKHRHAASIPHARYTQSEVSPCGVQIVRHTSHTAHTVMREV